MYFGRTRGRHHRDGRRRHGPVGPEGQALRRADPPAARRQAARPDSRPTPRSCSAATARRRPTSPGAGARPATRPSSSAGSRWARARRVDIDLVRGAREGLGDGDAADRRRLRVGRPHGPAAGRRPSPSSSIEWLEEPLREDDVDGYVWLRDRSPMPIAAGEGECGRESFRAADRPPGARRLPGRSVAVRLHRRGVHPRPRRRDRRPAVQPLLHQPADRGRQLCTG